MTATQPCPTLHHLDRAAVRIGGFTTPDRKLATPRPDGNDSSYDERVRPPHGYRLMVEGQRGVGFGLCAADADQFINIGPHTSATAPGPYLGAYGHAAVLDNYGGSGREIDESKAAGLCIDAKVGDILELDGYLWRIKWADQGRDRHNIELVRLVEA